MLAILYLLDQLLLLLLKVVPTLVQLLSTLNESDHFETLQTVGLNHVKLPDFEDRFIDQHLTVAPTVDTSWILFDSGAAANRFPRTSLQNGHFYQLLEPNPHFVA